MLFLVGQGLLGKWAHDTACVTFQGCPIITYGLQNRAGLRAVSAGVPHFVKMLLNVPQLGFFWPNKFGKRYTLIPLMFKVHSIEHSRV